MFEKIRTKECPFDLSDWPTRKILRLCEHYMPFLVYLK